MTNVQDGAQLSDDGQWWWDGSQWQPVDGEGDGGARGTAGFDFDVNGVRINAENSPVPSAGEELMAGFAVCNTGTAAGQCRVTIYVDGQDSGVTWESPSLEPGQCAAPDGDGYVHGIAAQSEGEHEFEAIADPPGNGGGRAVNTIMVEAAE
ncbi:MAG: hypothetical protein M3Q48_05600 [Actinomycetota bacterium]|nr:hypothetical protein [Actinomycetota bacterium]HSH22480.1 hypothetical protein [Acidimicrobiales bacterium]